MPPRWPRKPDRATDPDFRRLDDRMTFATHVALFAAVNSGLWFFRELGDVQQGIPGGLPWTPWITGIWATILLVHGIAIFAIVKYQNSTAAPSTAGTGFQPKDHLAKPPKR
ncbi:MAG TPA: 2TM domain-containing protein [Microcoleaceae cyanobacterium]